MRMHQSNKKLIKVACTRIYIASLYMRGEKSIVNGI